MNRKYAKILLVILVLAVVASSLFALSACDKKTPERTVFSEPRKYEFDVANTQLMNNSTIRLALAVLVDANESYLEFGTDGMVHGKIQTVKLNLDSLLDMLGDSFSKDSISAQIGAINLASMLASNAEPMFPGLTSCIVEGDIVGALELVQKSLGLNVSGLDLSSDAAKEAVAKMGEEYKNSNGKSMHLPSNLLDLIPNELCVALTVDWEYELVHLTGSDGTPHDAVYVGGVSHDVHTQPFGVFTMTTASNGLQKMSMRIEFLDANIAFKIPLEK